MKELVDKVKQCGLDRNIVFAGATSQDKRAMMEAQARYTLKETAKLLDAYADQDIDKINDAIGDILVTLIVGASSDDDIYKRLIDALEKNRFDDPFSNVRLTLHSAVAPVYNACNLIRKLKADNANWFDFDCCVDSMYCALNAANNEYGQSLTLKDCLELAYNEIKGRKGKLVNGQFVKEV